MAKSSLAFLSCSMCELQLVAGIGAVDSASELRYFFVFVCDAFLHRAVFLGESRAELCCFELLSLIKAAFEFGFEFGSTDLLDEGGVVAFVDFEHCIAIGASQSHRREMIW